MQAYNDSTGARYVEIFHAISAIEANRKMDARKAEIEAQGGTVTERRMLTKNSKCPCGSGRAIKRCCKHIYDFQGNNV